MASSEGRPRLPWRTWLFVNAASGLVDATRRRDGTVNRALLDLFDRRTPPNPTPRHGVSTSDHAIDPSRGLSVRLFDPRRAPSDDDDDDTRRPLPLPLPVVVYFHGGGFAFHSPATGAYDALCRRLARRIPARVVSVDYRRAPEHPFPAPYDDGADVLRWIRSGALPDSDPSAPLFLAGDSAGGNIAHHVARRSPSSSPSSSSEEAAAAAVAGLVAIQPFFGGEEATGSEERLWDKVAFGSRERFEWMWRAFLPPGSDRDHPAANVFGPGSRSGSEDWTGFPPTMVCVGGWDPLRDRQRMYAEGLRSGGVDARLAEYPDAIHGFFACPELPEARRFVDHVADFVNRTVGRIRAGPAPPEP